MPIKKSFILDTYYLQYIDKIKQYHAARLDITDEQKQILINNDIALLFINLFIYNINQTEYITNIEKERSKILREVWALVKSQIDYDLKTWNKKSIPGNKNCWVRPSHNNLRHFAKNNKTFLVYKDWFDTLIELKEQFDDLNIFYKVISLIFQCILAHEAQQNDIVEKITDELSTFFPSAAVVCYSFLHILYLKSEDSKNIKTIRSQAGKKGMSVRWHSKS